MNYIFEAEGKNRAEAEQKALEMLGVEASLVKIRPVNATRGILGFVTKKPVAVRVYSDSDTIPPRNNYSGSSSYPDH